MNYQIRSLWLSWKRIFIVCGIAFFSIVILFFLIVKPIQVGKPVYAAYLPPTTLESKPVITIGVGASLSGGVAFLGWPQANSVQLAVSQTNAAGGIDIGGTQYDVALVKADDGCNPTQGANAATTLINSGVVAVVGYTCSSASKAAQPIHYVNGVAMISPSSTVPDVTEQGFTTTFRVITHDDSPPIYLATYLRGKQKYENASIVEINGGSNNWANDLIANTFTALGGNITGRHTVASTSDFTSTLHTISNTETAQVIFYSDPDPNNAGLLSKIADNVGMTMVPIAWTTFTDDKSVLATYDSIADEAAEGDYAMMFYRDPGYMADYITLKTAYQEAGFPNYGNEPTATGAFAYDAANIIIKAIDEADTTNPTEIRNSIANTLKYKGVVGYYYGFNPKGDVVPQWMWLEVKNEGEWFTRPPMIVVGGGGSKTNIPFLGWPEINSVELALDQATFEGGIDIDGTSYQLLFASADDGCNPGQGANAATALINSGAVGVVGYTCSGASKGAQQVHQSSHVAMISPSATNPSVTEGGYDTTFRVITRDDTPNIFLAEYLYNHVGLTKISMVDYTNTWQLGVSDAFSITFTSLGGTITGRHQLSSMDEFTSTLDTIVIENPDAILYSDMDGNAAGTFSAIADNKGFSTIAWSTFTEDVNQLDNYVAQAGVAAEDDLAMMFYRHPSDMPGYPVFNNHYQARAFPNYGSEATAYGAFANDAAWIIIKAIQHGQSLNPREIRTEIAATTNFPGIVGVYEGFDSKGDVIPQWFWLVGYREGDWQQLYPFDVFIPLLLK